MKKKAKQTFLVFLVLFILFTQVFTLLKGLGLVKDVKLHGAVAAVPFPAITLDGVISGAFQRGIDSWLVNTIGLRGMYIKIENQINYSLFNFISGSPSVVLGKDRWLFEKSYIDHYNNKDVVPVQTIEGRIRDMAELQRLLAARGIGFLYLITPSKTTVYPEYIDKRYVEDDGAKKAGNYENALPLLKRYGINILNGREYYLARKKRDPLLLFPTSGTHWNYYSCRYFTGELIRHLEKITGKKYRGIADDGLVMKRDPFDTDKDLSRLTNLIMVNTFNTSYYYPVVKCANATASALKMSDRDDLDLVDNGPDCYYYAAARPVLYQNAVQPRVMAVGGSFMHTVFHFLDSVEFYHERDFLFYFSTNFEYPENTKTTLDKKNLDLKGALLKCDIVIVENNEQTMNDIGFGFIQDALKAMRQ